MNLIDEDVLATQIFPHKGPTHFIWTSFDSVNIDFTLDGDISVKNALENRKWENKKGPRSTLNAQSKKWRAILLTFQSKVFLWQKHLTDPPETLK